jgi:hypothetical protein
MRVFRFILSILMLSLIAGCGPPQHTAPLAREPETEAERNFRDLWEGARKTLKRYGFSLDRQDPRGGVINTFAVSGGHGLEALWRKDATSLYSHQENTAQNILRAALVKVWRVRNTKDQFDFSVTVLVARTNRPQPHLTSSTETMTMQVPRLPKLRYADLKLPRGEAGKPLRGYKSMVVPLGEDEALAAKIDQDIRAAAGLQLPIFIEEVLEEPAPTTQPVQDPEETVVPSQQGEEPGPGPSDEAERPVVETQPVLVPLSPVEGAEEVAPLSESTAPQEPEDALPPAVPIPEEETPKATESAPASKTEEPEPDSERE